MAFKDKSKLFSKRSKSLNKKTRKNIHSDFSNGISSMSEDQLYSFIDSIKNGNPRFLILDGVQDPHNLGACLRTAEASGVHAIIVPKHKSSPVTETVVRVSCGGANYVPVIAVKNMVNTIIKMRDEYGIFIIGTRGEAQESLYDLDLVRPLAFVLGSEGKGMRRLTRENCSIIVKIPMMGRVECLNVSNAAAICLYESLRQSSFLN